MAASGPGSGATGGGIHVAVVGAGPAGCLFASALLDGALARRRTFVVTLFDGGATLGRTQGPVVCPVAVADRLELPRPAGAVLRLRGVREVAGVLQVEAPADLLSFGRGELGPADLGAALRGLAVSRGARLCGRPVDEVVPAAGGGYVVRAAGASERAEYVILACGAGATLGTRLPGHRPPRLLRGCTATLLLDPAARRELGDSMLHVRARSGLPALLVVPTATGARVTAAGPDVDAAALAEALLVLVAAGLLPARFALSRPQRVLLPVGAASPGLPAVGEALGGLPFQAGLQRAEDQARRYSAALLDGGAPALLAAARAEAHSLARAAAAAHRRDSRWRLVPPAVVDRAIAREQAAAPEHRPVSLALARAAPGAAPQPRPALATLRLLLALLATLLLGWLAKVRRATAPARQRRAPERTERGDRIFVVDDDPEQAALVAAYLGALGHPCRTFSSGVSAAAAAFRERPAAIVLDVALPWLDGAGVCRALRRDPATSGMLVVLVTGLHRAAALRFAAACGADELLQKPLDLAELRRRLSGRGLPGRGAVAAGQPGELPGSRANTGGGQEERA